MALDATSIILLIAVGVVAGAVNTLAGGGSLLTLPAFVFLGLPAPVANGTNRVAILLQSLVGARAMHRRAPFPWQRTGLLTLPVLVGAISGAWLATRVEAEAMEAVIGGVLIFGAALLALRPKRFLRSSGTARLEPHRRAMLALTLVLVGFYGGFIQAGAGALFLLALVGVGRWDILPATGAKNLIIAAYSMPALIVFAVHHQVDWAAGLVAAIGTVAGAELGARLAMLGGRKLILWLVIVAVVLAAARLLGFV